MFRRLRWGWRLARVERYLTPDSRGRVFCPGCGYVVHGCWTPEDARPYLTRHLTEHVTGHVQVRWM